MYHNHVGWCTVLQPLHSACSALHHERCARHCRCNGKCTVTMSGDLQSFGPPGHPASHPHAPPPPSLSPCAAAVAAPAAATAPAHCLTNHLSIPPAQHSCIAKSVHVSDMHTFNPTVNSWPSCTPTALSLASFGAQCMPVPPFLSFSDDAWWMKHASVLQHVHQPYPPNHQQHMPAYGGIGIQ